MHLKHKNLLAFLLSVFFILHILPTAVNLSCPGTNLFCTILKQPEKYVELVQREKIFPK